MDKFESIVNAQRNFFNSGVTQDVGFRRAMLKKLDQALSDNMDAIFDALKTDLGKPALESYKAEVMLLKSELLHTRCSLGRWAKRRRVCTPVYLFPAKSMIVPKPYGTILIMSPWNYPLLLTIDPLIAAIAAGNTAVIKPSAYAPATSEVIARIISEIYPPEYVTVVQGGRVENQALLDQKFDYIFFTGSVAVGKTVMEKASAHLTPVSLELGGKSPVIVDETADLKTAARRIAFGKLINSGQTCVAPDYAFVQRSVRDEFVAELEDVIRRFYGEHPLTNDSWPKIVNRKHFDRLLGLIQGEDIVFGGDSDPKTNKIEPTILVNVTPDAKIMQEEIFGPILPILDFGTLDEPFDYVRAHERPLAAYLFSQDKTVQQAFLDDLTFGDGAINDTIMQLANPNLPFGGVGASGMGSYHGKFGFDTFTHYEGIIDMPQFELDIRYPEMGKFAIELLKKIL